MREARGEEEREGEKRDIDKMSWALGGESRMARARRRRVRED